MLTVKSVHEGVEKTFGDEAFDNITSRRTPLRSATLIAPDATLLALNTLLPTGGQPEDRILRTLCHTPSNAPDSYYKRKLEQLGNRNLVVGYTENASEYMEGLDDAPDTFNHELYSIPGRGDELTERIIATLERSVLISRAASRVLLGKLRSTLAIEDYTVECTKVLENPSQHIAVITADILEGWQEAEA
jgi:hypothetical protein